jgi:hypothetical protein
MRNRSGALSEWQLHHHSSKRLNRSDRPDTHGRLPPHRYSFLRKDSAASEKANQAEK